MIISHFASTSGDFVAGALPLDPTGGPLSSRSPGPAPYYMYPSIVKSWVRL